MGSCKAPTWEATGERAAAEPASKRATAMGGPFHIILALWLPEDFSRHLTMSVRVIAELAGPVGAPAVQRAGGRAGAAMAEAGVDGHETQSAYYSSRHQPIPSGSITHLTHLVLSPAEPRPLPMSAQV